MGQPQGTSIEGQRIGVGALGQPLFGCQRRSPLDHQDPSSPRDCALREQHPRDAATEDAQVCLGLTHG
jgi:hypothetical protein